MRNFQFSIIGALFALIGIGMTVWGIGILKDAKASTSWPTVQGEITGSRIDKSTSRDSDGHTDTTYRADVTYRYAVEDAEYTGDTVSFGEYGSDRRSHADRIVKRYPVGKEVKVHYDPEKPEKAVLEPGVTWSSYLVLGMGLFFTGGGLAFCYSRRWRA